jgi:hypothetical protein
MQWCGLNVAGPGYSQLDGSCEHDIKPLNFINSGEFFDWQTLLPSQKRTLTPLC